MAPRVISFISAKGGSGKTVTSSALATLISQLGIKVLLVDVDAATNGLTLLFLEQLLGTKRQRTLGQKFGVFETAENSLPPDKISVNENFDIVPAAYQLKDTEQVSSGGVELTLSRLIQEADGYDFVFLDAQAGADVFARTAVKAADTNIIVSEYDPVSSQGVERLKVVFGDVLDPAATWTLFNKVLPEFASSIGEGLSIAQFLPPVPWDADVVRAFSRRDLAIDVRAPNPYTLAIAQMAFVLAPDVIGPVITDWRSEIKSGLTSPVSERLQVISDMIKGLAVNRRRERLRILLLTSLLFAASGVGLAGLGGYFLTDGPVNGGSIWQWLSAGGWIAVPFVVLTPFLMDLVLTITSTDESKDIAATLLREEEAKLRANLDATTASLRLNEKLGPFGSIRYHERLRRIDT